MKERYETPAAEMIVFDDTDIIVTSGRGDRGNGRGCGKAHGNGNC